MIDIVFLCFMASPRFSSHKLVSEQEFNIFTISQQHCIAIFNIVYQTSTLDFLKNCTSKNTANPTSPSNSEGDVEMETEHKTMPPKRQPKPNPVLITVIVIVVVLVVTVILVVVVCSMRQRDIDRKIGMYNMTLWINRRLTYQSVPG